MTDDQIRITISEALGWKRVRQHWEKDGETRWLNDDPLHYLQLDNFHKDLNAMHEVETKVIPLDKREEYRQRLTKITQKNRMATIAWTNITATARQRAEAFLRMIGRWTE